MEYAVTLETSPLTTITRNNRIRFLLNPSAKFHMVSPSLLPTILKRWSQ